ncbi:hypothetical protein V6N13_088024 [Hibiscus sabdariffa]
MAEQSSMLRLQDRHITSLTVDEMDDEETFKHHLTMAKISPDVRIHEWLKAAGFYHATFIRGFKLVPALIAALIERWRPETHTFHMPCGECTITLEDVVMLIGVPVNGAPLIGTPLTGEPLFDHTQATPESICAYYLGKVPGQSNFKGPRLKLSWLQNEFQLGEYNSVQDVYNASRAYVMQLIGGILMPDKSGNLVHTRYLRFLRYPWEAASYSWGSAILAFLYRELCKGAKIENGRKVRGIGGCLLLLQAWAWERLPFWTPITRTSVQFPLVASVTPLIHFAIVEFQYGDRVLRQFGFHQPIPYIDTDHDYLHDYDERGRAEVQWEVVHAEYINMWNDRVSTVPHRAPSDEYDFDFERSEYLTYFMNNGKPYLTTVDEREECRRYKKKYGGKGESSRAAARAVQNVEWPRDTTGWPASWGERVEMPSPVIWERGSAPTNVSPEVVPSPLDTHGFDSADLYRPEFDPPQSPIYTDFGQSFDMQNFMSSSALHMGMDSGDMDIFTTPPPMPTVNEDPSYNEEDAEEDSEEPLRAAHRARKPPQSYLSTTSVHGQKLRKKIT